MNEKTQAIKDDMGTLVEDARALFNATSNAAEEKVVAARNRLAATLESGKKSYDSLRERAVEGVKTADQAVRDHLYATIGIAFGVGALLGGILLHRR